MKPARAVSAVTAAVVLLSALGCATQAARGAGDAAEVGAALARLRPAGDAPVNASGHAMAYLVYRGQAGPSIAAYDLARSALVWQQAGEATGRIEVGRTAIVHAAKGPGGGAVLIGRAGDSGAVLWRQEIPGDQRLIGYCLDGDVAYFVARAFSDTGSHGSGALVALDARTGAGRGGGRAGRHPVPDPPRRRQRRRARAHPVHRGGRQLRAHRPRGNLLRIEGGVPRVGRHRQGLAPLAGLRLGQAAALRARDLRP
ncbi:MAG TPA: hypothetical protein VFH68_07455 [Polyangia bacterium]|jgi:hypothetical protein|nr:hypothetical protein [Polyangia bacterium]